MTLQHVPPGRLFFAPSGRRRRTRARTDAATSEQRSGYLAHRGRDLNRIHVYRVADGWAAFVPAWRPQAFADDGLTLLTPYGQTTHGSRVEALDHVRDYLASRDAMADREEMMRLYALGGFAAVRRLTTAREHAGRVDLDEAVADAPWTRHGRRATSVS